MITWPPVANCRMSPDLCMILLTRREAATFSAPVGVLSRGDSTTNWSEILDGVRGAGVTGEGC